MKKTKEPMWFLVLKTSIVLPYVIWASYIVYFAILKPLFNFIAN